MIALTPEGKRAAVAARAAVMIVVSITSEGWYQRVVEVMLASVKML